MLMSKSDLRLLKVLCSGISVLTQTNLTISSHCLFISRFASEDFAISAWKWRWDWMNSTNQRRTEKARRKVFSRRNLISHSFIYKRCLQHPTFLTIKWKLRNLDRTHISKNVSLTVKIYLEGNIHTKNKARLWKIVVCCVFWLHLIFFSSRCCKKKEGRLYVEVN